MIRLRPHIDGREVTTNTAEKESLWAGMLGALCFYAVCGGLGLLSLYVEKITLIVMITEIMVTGLMVAIMLWLWTLTLKDKIAAAKEDARIARAGNVARSEPRYRK